MLLSEPCMKKVESGIRSGSRCYRPTEFYQSTNVGECVFVFISILVLFLLQEVCRTQVYGVVFEMWPTAKISSCSDSHSASPIFTRMSGSPES